MGEIQAETGFGKFEFTHAIEIRSHQCHPPHPQIFGVLGPPVAKAFCVHCVSLGLELGVSSPFL